MSFHPELNKRLKRHGFHIEYDPRTRELLDKRKNDLGIQIRKSKDHGGRVGIVDQGTEPRAAMAFVLVLGYKLCFGDDGFIEVLDKERPLDQ